MQDEQTTEQLSEPTPYDVDSIKKQSKLLNVLAAIAIPHVIEFLFPAMYVYFWEKCRELATMERGFPKLALGIPRGHAKTIFLKLLILYMILHTKRRFIMVICANENLAMNILTDVCAMLDHPNIRKLFGNWDEDRPTNKKEHKKFRFRGRMIILAGVGVGTSFRGISEEFARPDVMIFDDSQTKDCANSITQSLQYASWFRGTAMKAKDPKFCFYLYVGNMYPKLVIKDAEDDIPAIFACMLKNLKLSKSWESIVVGGLLADGTALWEELQSREQLLLEYEEDRAAGMEAVFLAEVMNDDEAIDSGMFDETKVPEYPFTPDEVGQARFLMIDPSLGKSTSDEQMVGDIKIIDGHTVVDKLIRKQVSAPVLVRDCIDYCLENNIPAIAIEAYAYQASLGQWFEAIMDADSPISMDGIHGVEGIQILLISRGRASKNSAIRSSFKEVMGGDLWISPKAWAMWISEVRTFNPMSSDNKDNCLDIGTYANLVKLKFPTEILTDLLISVGQDATYVAEVKDIGMSYS